MTSQDSAQATNRLVAAWSAAAVELGLDIERDVRLAIRNGEFVAAPLLIMRFGTVKGTVVWLGDAAGRRRELGAAAAAGMAVSFLSPTYEVYDRELFIGTLNDWGWRGETDPPTWYTGRSWT